MIGTTNSRYGVNREIYINNSYKFYTGRSGGNVGESTAINTVYTSQTSTDEYNTYGFYTWDGYLLEYKTNTKSSTHDISKVASTTGNITGVYDMSGGAWDNVMGVLSDANGNPRSGNSSSLNSGFNGLIYDDGNNTQYTDGIDFPNGKYYDLYTTPNSLIACNGGICYGHVLSEVSNWYGDSDKPSIGVSGPWFQRGASYGMTTEAGAFNFIGDNGSANNSGFIIDDSVTRSVLLLNSN